MWWPQRQFKQAAVGTGNGAGVRCHAHSSMSASQFPLYSGDTLVQSSKKYIAFTWKRQAHQRSRRGPSGVPQRCSTFHTGERGGGHRPSLPGPQSPSGASDSRASAHPLALPLLGMTKQTLPGWQRSACCDERSRAEHSRRESCCTERSGGGRGRSWYRSCHTSLPVPSLQQSICSSAFWSSLNRSRVRSREVCSGNRGSVALSRCAGQMRYAVQNLGDPLKCTKRRQMLLAVKQNGRALAVLQVKLVPGCHEDAVVEIAVGPPVPSIVADCLGAPAEQCTDHSGGTRHVISDRTEWLCSSSPGYSGGLSAIPTQMEAAHR